MTDHDRDRHSLIDRDHAACLCDVGAPGWAAAATIRADGSTDYWLVDLDQLDNPDAPHGSSTEARHEQTGPLPDEWQRRITRATTYRLDPRHCNRPTATGQRCRIEVRTRGAACHWHRRPGARQTYAPGALDKQPTEGTGE